MGNFALYSDPTVNGSTLSAQGIGALTSGMYQPSASFNQGLSLANTPIAGAGAAPGYGLSGGGFFDGIFGGGSGDGPGFWSKEGGAGILLGGAQILGNLWNSYQAQKMAKEQMGFAKEQWRTNLANQTQTYNTALEDRIRARHFTEGRDSSETDAYLEKHSL